MNHRIFEPFAAKLIILGIIVFGFSIQLSCNKLSKIYGKNRFESAFVETKHRKGKIKKSEDEQIKKNFDAITKDIKLSFPYFIFSIDQSSNYTSKNFTTLDSVQRMENLTQFYNNYPQSDYAILAQFVKSFLLFDMKQYDETMKTLDKILGQFHTIPDVIVYLYSLTAIKSGISNSRSVLKIINELENNIPKSVLGDEINLIKAKILVNTGNLSESLKLCEKVIETSTLPYTKGKSIFLESEIFRMNSNWNSYIKSLLKIPQLYPEADIPMNLLNLLDKAPNKYINNLSSADLLSLGRYLYYRKNYNSAEKYLKKVIVNTKKFVITENLSEKKIYYYACYFLAKTYMARNKLSLAETLLNKEYKAASRIKEIMPVSTELLILLGQIYTINEKEDKAIAVFTEIINNSLPSETLPEIQASSTPLKFIALQQLIKIYALMNDKGREIQVVDYLLQTYPETEGADKFYKYIARYYYLKGKLDISRKYYEELLANFPKSSLECDALFWLGKINRDNNAESSAYSKFQQIISTCPYSFYAYRASSFLGNTESFLRLQDNSADNYLERMAGKGKYNERDKFYLENGDDLKTINLFFLAQLNYKQINEKSSLKNLAVINLGKVYNEMGNFPAAIKIVENRMYEKADFFEDVVLTPKNIELLFPQQYLDVIKSYSNKFSVSPELVISVIRQESRFDKMAVSSSNALGLMQIIPSTGKWIALKLGINNFQSDNLFSSETNIYMGAWYLKYLLNRFNNNIPLAVAAYNAGPTYMQNFISKNYTNDLDDFIESIPREETRDYVKKVLFNNFVYEGVIGGNRF